MLTTFEFLIHDFMCYLCIHIGTGNIILNVPQQLGKWYLPNYAHLCQNELTVYAWSRYKKSLLKPYSSLKKNYTVFVNQCGFDTVISVIKKVPMALANRTSCNMLTLKGLQEVQRQYLCTVKGFLAKTISDGSL